MSGRCVACNKKLSAYEMTRKDVDTGNYLDLCCSCSEGMHIRIHDRPDLLTTDDVDSGEEDDFDSSVQYGLPGV